LSPSLDLSQSRLQSVFNNEHGELVTPYFRTYFRSIWNHRFSHYIEKVQNIVSVLELDGSQVADLGCGFGIMAMEISILSNSFTVGVDADMEKIMVAETIARNLQIPRVDFKRESIDSTTLEKGRFDAVILNEVISHTPDISALFREVSRLLRLGGRLMVNDSNNGANLASMVKHHAAREKYESDFQQQRRQILRELGLNEETARWLARFTRGMTRAQILDAAHNYLTLQKKPTPSSDVRDPNSGLYEERMFNPIAIRPTISKFGFKARLCKPWYAPESKLRSAVAQLLLTTHPLSVLIAPSYRIIATKVK